jgi:hypothetical protein
MTSKMVRLQELADMATKHVNSLRVGDVSPGAYGAAAECGITDLTERSAFTAVWLAGWDGLRGKAAIHAKDAPAIIVSIDTP